MAAGIRVIAVSRLISACSMVAIISSTEGRNGCPGPIPSLSTIYRVLVRHHLVDPVPRRRRRPGLQTLAA